MLKQVLHLNGKALSQGLMAHAITMAPCTRTVATVLVAAALIVAVVLYTARDQTGHTNNQISEMISSEVKRDKAQMMSQISAMDERANSKNLQVGKNAQTGFLEKLVKGLKEALKTMQKDMQETDREHKRQIKALHDQLHDARGQGSVDTKAASGKDGHPQDDEDALKITKWWQASTLLKWDWEKPPEYRCSKIEKRGNWHICNDTIFEVKPPCLVYSFGIWNDWSFDDAMGALGCEVHSFDPSIGLKSFNRSKNVHFHDLGLSGKDSDTYVPTKDIYVKHATTWKIRRLKTIMEMLGHTNRHLDFLKIDIETSEWPAVKDMAASGMFSKVRQFAVEWHLFPTYPSRSEYVGIYAGVMAMKKQGLRTFRADFHGKDYRDKTFRFQADVNYVNILYKGM